MVCNASHDVVALLVVVAAVANGLIVVVVTWIVVSVVELPQRIRTDAEVVPRGIRFVVEYALDKRSRATVQAHDHAPVVVCALYHRGMESLCVRKSHIKVIEDLPALCRILLESCEYIVYLPSHTFGYIHNVLCTYDHGDFEVSPVKHKVLKCGAAVDFLLFVHEIIEQQKHGFEQRLSLVWCQIRVRLLYALEPLALGFDHSLNLGRFVLVED